jgi:hypothetical protein
LVRLSWPPSSTTQALSKTSSYPVNRTYILPSAAFNRWLPLHAATSARQMWPRLGNETRRCNLRFIESESWPHHCIAGKCPVHRASSPRSIVPDEPDQRTSTEHRDDTPTFYNLRTEPSTCECGDLGGATWDHALRSSCSSIQRTNYFGDAASGCVFDGSGFRSDFIGTL